MASCASTPPSRLAVVDVAEFPIHDVAVLRRPGALGATAAASALTVHGICQRLGRAGQTLLRPPDPFDVVAFHGFARLVECLLYRRTLGIGEVRAVFGPRAVGRGHERVRAVAKLAFL